jgi:hypothetical protein
MISPYSSSYSLIVFHHVLGFQVFDFDKWRAHRSQWKYLEQILSLPFSHTIRSILLPLIWIIFVTLCVGGNFFLADKGYLPRWAMLPHLTGTGSEHCCCVTHEQ